MKSRPTHLILALVAAVTLVSAAQNDAARTMLEAARKAEVVDGDLKGAIRQYSAIVDKYKNDRAVVADALLRMAAAYEKLGDSESRKIYEQILREYADQKEAATLARERLGDSATTSSTRIVTRQLWTVPPDALGTRAPDGLGTVSPDGRYFSFVDWSTGELSLHDFETGENRRLTNTARTNAEYAEESVISRDGKRVAYAWFNKDGYELRLLDLNDNSAKPRILFANHEVDPWVFPYDWSPDGKWVAVQLKRADGTGQMALVSTADGALRVLKSADWRRASGIVFSPDGKYLAYDIPASIDSEQRDIYIMATDASRETPAVVNPANDVVLGWARDGKHLLFASDRSGTNGVWALLMIDGKVQGEPKLIKADVNLRARGFTRSGALYFSATLSQQDIYVASVDFATGKLLSPPTRIAQQNVGFNDSPQWSPDGEYLAYLPRRDPSVVAIQSMATGKIRELRPNLAYVLQERPLWSPDGSFLLVVGPDKKGRWGIHRVDAQTGETVPLAMSTNSSANTVHPIGWSPDGHTLYFRRECCEMHALDMQSGQERAVDRISAMFAPSPDGRLWALIDRSSNSSSLQVVPAAGGQPHELLRVSAPEDLRAPMWSPDGKFLLCYKTSARDTKNQVVELWSIPAEGGTLRKIDLGGAVPTLPYNDGSWARSFHIHPDGRQVAFTMRDPKSEIWEMENFLPALNAKK